LNKIFHGVGFAFGSLGCLCGAFCFGLATIILPLADLTLPALTMHGHRSRRSLARENLRIYSRFTRDFAVAVVSSKRRKQLNSLIR